MNEVEVETFVWRRFYLERFSIVPILAGKAHEFSYNGKMATVTLPKPTKPLTPDSVRVSRKTDLITCNSWIRDGAGNLVPTKFDVRCVDLRLQLDAPVAIPQELLARSPNQYDLVSEAKKKQLSRLVTDNAGLAGEAFSYWLSVLRWKSGIAYIGEPSIRHPGHSTGGAVLCAANTGHRFWLQDYMFAILREDPVTEDHWGNAQGALSKSKIPPVWFDFLFQSQQRLNNLDLIGSILSLAVSLEVCIRILATCHMRDLPIEAPIREIVDISNLRAVLTRLNKLSFWNSDWKSVFDAKQFHRLMDARDQIMHAANTTTLDEPELRRIYQSVKAFAYKVSEYLDATDHPTIRQPATTP